MSDIIDINVYETSEDVTINVTESVIEVNINQVSSGSIGAWGSIIGDIADQTDLQNALDLKENDLGNPLVDGYVLSSTVAGVRSWIEQGGAGGGEWGTITGELSDQVDLQSALDNKVDKVVGKELSTNDFTDALETKLNGIEAGAEVNVNADWNAISGDAQILNKPTIPSITGLVPYTGATSDVNLGVYDITAAQIIKDGGLPNQFLKADGSVDSNSYYLASNPNGYTTNLGTVTSVGLTMPPAFNVANSPITSSGTLAVTAAGTASQYIRGDGSLATIPSTSSGGSSVNYYLNGSIPASVAGYYQMSNSAVIGAGTDFNLTGNGLIAQFLTDAGNPNRLLIPGGAWNFEMYFNVSSVGGNSKFYVELLKYDGTTFTSISSSAVVPEDITGGTNVDLYVTSVAVPETVLLITDRLAIRVYIVDNSGGRTVTLHTEDNTLCEIITTFAGGISALNGLTANTQYLGVGTSGTDFNISSVSDTHTFNLPTASSINRGALSSSDWTAFNGKQDEVYVTPEQYGAIGDGVTDDKTAIQNAINSGKPVQLKKKRYFISGSIELIDGTIIIGTGTGSITNIYITANAPAFLIKGSNINIERISFIGDYSFATNSYSTSKPNQHAIALIGTIDFVTQYDRILISNCTFYNMSGAGFYSKYNIGGNSLFAGGAQLTNNLAFGCAFGYYNDVRGEYNSFVNNKAYYCTIGYRSSGGNNIFTGGILNSNNTGAYLESGANNGHSYIDCTSLNHNFQYGVWTNGITLGYTISNSPIYANDIYVQDSIGIKFFNCDISCNNIYVQTSTLTEFKENKFTTTPTLSLAWNGTNNTGTLNTVRFFNNFFWGANPAGLQNDVLNNNLDVSGEISSTTETASTIASFDSNKKIKSLPVATYPDLTELSYVKGTTSAIQTQLNGKQATLTNPITGTGTTNKIPKFTGTSALGDSQIFDNGTNVGIGTTSPASVGSYKVLDINGTSGSYLGLKTAETETGRLYSDTTQTTLEAQGARFVSLATNGLERMRINSSGNVGINQITPTEKLHVVGNGLFSGNVRAANIGIGAAANLASYLNVIANTSTVGQIYFPPSAVDYTGTVSGMLWNNASEWKFYDGVTASVNRFIKLNGNSILANANALNVVTSTGTGGNLGTLKAETAFSRFATAVSYTILLTDVGFGWVIAVTSTAAARTITLPLANAVPAGWQITVKDESGGALTNNITIARAGSDTIDGATSNAINLNYGSRTLYSDGVSKWFII